MSKIFHFNDLEEFFAGDEWKLQIDVTDLWNQFNDKKIDLNNFNTQYHNRLLGYKDDITELGNDVWEKLNGLLLKLEEKKKQEELLPVYDDIYNWADQNDILIKTN